MDERRGRARIGLLVPFTNTNFEPDMALMAPQGVVFHTARMAGYDADEIPDASQMAGLGASDLGDPLRLLCAARPDLILYGCTSATLTHGPGFDAELAARINAMSGAASLTAAGALVATLCDLSVTKIAFASPYVPQINAQAIAFLAQHGIETVAEAAVEEVLDNEGQGAMTPEAVFDLGIRAARSAGQTGAEALVLSCTDMRAVEVISDLEKAIGMPVVTSNQALMHRSLIHLGIVDPVPGFGCLLERRGHVL